MPPGGMTLLAGGREMLLAMLGAPDPPTIATPPSILALEPVGMPVALAERTRVDGGCWVCTSVCPEDMRKGFGPPSVKQRSQQRG